MSKRSFFVIVLGILLIALGIGGYVVKPGNQEQIIGKGNDRYFEKKVIQNAVVPSVEKVDLAPLTTDISLITGDLSQYSYVVHSTRNPELETPLIPDRIEIPTIKLVAPIVISEFNFTKVEGETFGQWMAPSEFAAAWQPNSATLGEKGNTVINGHHNEFGEVFGKLIDLKAGDIIYVYSRGVRFKFVIANKMILKERWEKAQVRLENAKWLGNSDDIRLTLVTCWPADSNTHRLILVARPY